MAYSNPEDQKKCAAAHYRKNKAKYLAQVKASNRRRLIKIRELVRSIKDTPCVDCGVKYPYYVMQFDHVKGVKSFNISTAIAKVPVAALLHEISLCEVVCANCHAIRTHLRCKSPALPLS